MLDHLNSAPAFDVTASSNWKSSSVGNSLNCGRSISGVSSHNGRRGTTNRLREQGYYHQLMREIPKAFRLRDGFRAEFRKRRRRSLIVGRSFAMPMSHRLASVSATIVVDDADTEGKTSPPDWRFSRWRSISRGSGLQQARCHAGIGVGARTRVPCRPCLQRVIPGLAGRRCTSNSACICPAGFASNSQHVDSGRHYGREAIGCSAIEDNSVDKPSLPLETAF